MKKFIVLFIFKSGRVTIPESSTISPVFVSPLENTIMDLCKENFVILGVEVTYCQVKL